MLIIFIFFIFFSFFQINTQPNVILNNKITSSDSKKTLENTDKNKITTKEDEEKISKIYLNFENATLSSVVNFLSEQKKINIIPRKELDNIKVTLSTRNPLTLDKAWDVLLTLLEINNFTIINVNNLYRIIPKPQNKKEPLPSYSSATGTEPEDLPKSDLVVRYSYFLKNIKASTAASFLSTMLEGSIEKNDDLDVCIITDKCLNIKAAMKIVKELDQGGLREAIKIIPLKYTDAQYIEKIFNDIIPSSKQQQSSIRFLRPQQHPSTYFSTDTKIIKETRSNSLILLGTANNLEKISNFIYKYIDIPLRATKSRLHIIELKYVDAEKMQKLLTNIIKTPEGIPKSTGEFQFFENVIFKADSFKTTEDSRGREETSKTINGGGNRLIIACNEEDWLRIKKFINKIDKPQPQIAFEVLIVDVSIAKNNELWTQFKPKKNNILGNGVKIRFRTATDPLTDGISDDVHLVGLGYSNGTYSAPSAATNLTFGKTDNLWGTIKAVLKQNNYNIITQPFLVTNNNQKCSINAQETRNVEGPLVEKTVVATTTPVKEIVTREAKTLVELTPKINLEGTLDLKIYVDISAFTNADPTDSQDASAKIIRTLDTKVNIGSGEVLVLGGLTRNTIKESHNRIPILSKIPLLGNLFRTKTKEKDVSNLYIFIRPSIIKPQFEGVPDEYTEMKLDYAKYQMFNVDSYAVEKDPIQRWFFKPTDQTVKQKLSDAKKGIYRPIDDYTYGANQPKSVDIKHDPYYRSEETLKEQMNKPLLTSQTKIKSKNINNIKSTNKPKKTIVKRKKHSFRKKFKRRT